MSSQVGSLPSAAFGGNAGGGRLRGAARPQRRHGAGAGAAAGGKTNDGKTMENRRNLGKSMENLWEMPGNIGKSWDICGKSTMFFLEIDGL